MEMENLTPALPRQEVVVGVEALTENKVVVTAEVAEVASLCSHGVQQRTFPFQIVVKSTYNKATPNKIFWLFSKKR